MNYRHGDISLIGIDTLPKGLTETKTNVIIGADRTSGGNEHTFKGGKIYLKEIGQFIFGYLEAKNTILFHEKHGDGKKKLKEAKIEDGMYELRRQNEIKHEGMSRVID